MNSVRTWAIRRPQTPPTQTPPRGCAVAWLPVTKQKNKKKKGTKWCVASVINVPSFLLFIEPCTQGGRVSTRLISRAQTELDVNLISNRHHKKMKKRIAPKRDRSLDSPYYFDTLLLFLNLMRCRGSACDGPCGFGGGGASWTRANKKRYRHGGIGLLAG